MSPSLSEIAEDAGAYMRPGPGDIREEHADVVLMRRPSSETFDGHHASRLRLPADPRTRIEEIRHWFRSRGTSRWMWVLGPSTTPVDLEAHLRTGHAVRRTEEEGHRALLLDHAPPRGATGIEVREVLTY